jgi:phage terminase large subunit-like protein
MIARFAHLSEEERAQRFSTVERVAMLDRNQRERVLRGLSGEATDELFEGWLGQARPPQEAPNGDWRVWLMLSGRGFGKTRAGSEWVHGLAAAPGLRIALVGPSEDEVRSVMVEGASGLLACAEESNRPLWEPSKGLLTWPSGSRAFVHSAANPEALRGPEHDYAWCDEAAKWAQGEAVWDNLMFGLRRGPLPRVLVTTTPRPTPLMRRISAMPGLVETKGRTADNVRLSDGFVSYVTGLYGGTRLGRQELDGVLVDDVEGSLWPRELIEASRTQALSPGPSPASGRGEWRRVVVGVDPPASVGGDACGIVVCGLGEDGRGYVLADSSVAGLRPEGWARAAAAAAEAWGADRVVAEANQGGAMVETVLRSAEVALPVKLVHASRGKVARAEPVATLFEGGRAKFAGAFPELEDELAGLTIGGGYEGPGRSPDRADAMVWAMTELMLGRKRVEPRIRML